MKILPLTLTTPDHKLQARILSNLGINPRTGRRLSDAERQAYAKAVRHG